MTTLYRVYIEIEANELRDLAPIFHAIIREVSRYPPETSLQHPRVIIEEQRKK